MLRHEISYIFRPNRGGDGGALRDGDDRDGDDPRDARFHSLAGNLGNFRIQPGHIPAALGSIAAAADIPGDSTLPAPAVNIPHRKVYNPRAPERPTAPSLDNYTLRHSLPETAHTPNRTHRGIVLRQGRGPAVQQAS